MAVELTCANTYQASTYLSQSKMNLKQPRVSVLLPVYNGAKYLAAAIESVLTQSFSEIELLILNDGSTDESGNIAKSYLDGRIRYFEHPNVGLPATLNLGASFARGEFLFRQDQDDISYPERLLLQLDYLDKHPDVAMLGSWARIFDHRGLACANRYHRHPTKHASITLCNIFDSSFVHSSVAIRRSDFEALGGYSCDPMRQPPEDFEFWSRMCRHRRVANLAEVLVDYREVASSMSRMLRQDFGKRLIKITTENLIYWLNGSPFVQFANKLANIYHLNGYAPTISEDSTIINGSLGHISRTLSSCEYTNLDEFEYHLLRIRNQLLRNCLLGRYPGKVSRLALKAGLRVLSKKHGQ